MGGIPKTVLVEAGAWVAPQALIGDRAVIKAGAYVCSGVVIGPEVHVGPNATFVEAREGEGAGAQVEQGAWIGASATILPGIVIAAKAVVRPGAVVTRSVPPNAIVEGNPATIIGYVGADDRPLDAIHLPNTDAASGVEVTAARGVTLHRFPVIPDLRGTLSVGEFGRQIPFVPKRYFLVYGVPNREVRGEHAHINCQQFLICLNGSCAVIADDGSRRVEVTLDAPNLGLYLPPMIWGTQYKHTPDAMLLVFASDYYDSSDYIRDYPEFIHRIGETTVHDANQNPRKAQ